MSRTEADKLALLSKIMHDTAARFNERGTRLQLNGTTIQVTHLGRASLEQIRAFAKAQVPDILSDTFQVNVVLLELAA